MTMHHGRINKAWMTGAGIVAGFVAAALFVASSAQENLGRGRISGQVKDEAGAPVEGVQIIAQSIQGPDQLEAVTDGKGRFSILGLGTGVWRITAKKTGYNEVVQEIQVYQLRTNPPIELVLTRPAVAAKGESGIPLIDEGNAALEQGKFDEALALYRAFQARSPDVYGIRINIAAALFKKGDPAGAEAEYKGVLEDVLRVHGEYAKDKVVSARALAGLGELAFQAGDAETGRKYFTEVLAIAPDDEMAAYNLGEILFAAQNIDEAIRFYEMAAAAKKDWPKPCLKLGYAYLNKGDYDKAIENFNTFVALDPEDPEVPKVKSIIEAVKKMKK